MIYETTQSDKGGRVTSRSHKTEHPELANNVYELHRMSRGPNVSH